MTDIRFPELDVDVPAVHPSADTLSLLSQRRSSSAALLQAPGPNAAELSQILRLAARVPDHRKVAPFRFVTFGPDARAAFAEVLVNAAKTNADARHLPADAVRGLFLRAPTVLALISSVDAGHKTPIWEQHLTAGAVGYGILLAASAMGYAGQWLTEWYAYDLAVSAALGLSDSERVAGFFYLGTASVLPKERARPDMDVIVSAWTARP